MSKTQAKKVLRNPESTEARAVLPMRISSRSWASSTCRGADDSSCAAAIAIAAPTAAHNSDGCSMKRRHCSSGSSLTSCT